MEWLIELDRSCFHLINQSGTPFWDSLMLFATHKLSWIPLYLILIFFIVKEKGQESIWILATIGLVIACCDLGSVHLFKNTFQRLRPCHFFDSVRLVTEGCGGQYGFVSSHASNVFGLAIVIGKLMNKKYLFLALFFWASIVSYSRVYVGVHYPLDILGGMIWGTFVALIFVSIYKLIRK
jgi:undecaprenyl-diphosphatase